jgi:hypothetical protein
MNLGVGILVAGAKIRKSVEKRSHYNRRVCLRSSLRPSNLAHEGGCAIQRVDQVRIIAGENYQNILTDAGRVGGATLSQR